MFDPVPESNFSSMYLSRSLGTIIYDDNNIFTNTNITKQIDYPYVHQYNMCKNNQLLPFMLYFNNTSGLDYEILKCYFPNIKNLPISYEENNNGVRKYIVKDYNIFNFRKRNINKSWNDQLFEKNNNDCKSNQKDNQVCFISNMPLYNKGIVLELANDTTTDDKIYIVVCPHIYSNYIYNELINSTISHSIKKKKILILNKYIVYINRTENEVVNTIPDDLIHPLKKDILCAISLNGAVFYWDNNIRHVITVNVETNKIYLGFPHIINDSIIIKYSNTNTVLFSYMII